jgi:hypothetical protein
MAFAGALLLACTPLAAQDGSDDDLFGEDEVVETGTLVEEGDTASVDDVLVDDVLRFSGSIQADFSVFASWADPWGGSLNPLSPDANGLSPSVDLILTMSAHPTKEFSVYGDLRASYPFEYAFSDGTETFYIPAISVFALYSKVMIAETVFATFGKQPLRWGVGYFYSPADDVFALSAIDVLDPDAEREGPLALKLTYSIPLTVASIALYAGLPPEDVAQGANPSYVPEDTAFALKAEALFGNTEIALAGYWRYDDKARVIAMATTGNGDINLFAEALLQIGSNRPYLYKRETPVMIGMFPTYYYTDERADGLFFIGTIGGIWMDSELGLTVAAQYRFNGEGQDSTLTLEDAVTAYGESQIPTNDAVDQALLGYLFGWGQHHAAVSASWTEIFDSDFSLSVTALMSLQDLSGIVMPRLSWAPWDYVTLSVGGTFSFGEAGDEFVGVAPTGGTPTAKIDFMVSIGSGSF